MSTVEASGGAASQPVKLDPEALAIRTRPPRAIRFKRGAIIAIAALGSISLVVVTWMALRPQFLRGAAAQEELSQPNARPTDALNGAPATYGDVPKLGPPLPGDLGKPILDRQQLLAIAGEPSGQQFQQMQQIEQAAATERERRLADLKAARESGVLVQGRSASSAMDTGPSVVPVSASSDPGSPPGLRLDPAGDPNAQGRKEAFVASIDPRGDVNPHRLAASPSPYTLSAGSVISAESHYRGAL